MLEIFQYPKHNQILELKTEKKEKGQDILVSILLFYHKEVCFSLKKLNLFGLILLKKNSKK